MIRKLSLSLVVLGLWVASCGLASAQTFNNIPALSFTQPFGGANPLPQIITVTSTGDDFRFSVAASTTTGGSWLSVSPSGGNCCATAKSLTVTVAPSSGLAAGTYTGKILLTSSSGATLNVPVALTIAASSAAFFDTLPGQVSFSFLTAAHAPPNQFIQIRNAGSGALNWTLSSSTADGGSWLNSSASGSSAPSIISIGITPSALPGAGQIPGTYIGQLVFHSSASTVSIPVSVTVGDSVFKQVNALNFTKPYAGNNPLPQTLTVASTGSDFRIDAIAYNGAGGNWLTIAPGGGNCCSTPVSITVNVNPSVSLAAGTYTSEVVLTGNGLAMTVPVTLTIGTPSSQSFFDNMPGQISFSLETGGTAPPSQAVQVRQAGLGTLNWTLVSSTADGGNWLTTSVPNGTAPSMVSIGLNPAYLPYGGKVAGTFVGQLVFQTFGDVVTIPVSVTVGDSVFEQVNGIDFTKPYAGADPLPQTLTIASTGDDFRFNVAAFTATGGSWLTVSPSGGNCCSTTESLTISVNTASSLPAGTYTGQVVISQAGNSMTMTVPVTLTVRSSAAFFDNLPGQLSFSASTSGGTPPMQPIQVRNAGTGTLNWTVAASTADGGNWLAVSVASGTAPSTLTVGVNRSALPGGGQVAGTYTGQLVFQTAGDIVTIPVSVAIGASVFEQVNAINFTKPYAGLNPLPQLLTIASTGADFRVNVSASTSAGGDWLTVSPAGGNCCSTPQAITVSVNPSSNLAAGIYTGEILISQSGNSMSMTVPVTLTVAASSSAFFDNLPGQVSFSMKTSGTTPPSQPIQVRNGGAGTLNWSVAGSTSDGASWLVFSAASGVAPSTLSVSINKAMLPGGGSVAGTFTGQLVFQTSGDVVTVPVSVTVGDSVFQQINPLNFTKPYAGANPLPQTLMLGSTGADFRVNVQAVTATGGDWLSVTPAGGNCCSTTSSFTVNINAASALAAGTYTGQIMFSSGGMAMTVPVTLTVAPSSAAFFDNVQGQLSYSLIPGGGNPPSHSIQIRNAGAGALNWTLSGSTSDGGNWLTASLTSGAAPSAVTIGVNKAALPNGGQVAGLFTGQLLLQTQGDAVTIPVSVIVGDSVFQQMDTLGFSKSAGGSNPPAQTLAIKSTGTDFRINVSAFNGAGGNWLQVTPSGGNCCSTPQSLTVSVNPSSSLPAGVYTAQIVVSDQQSMTIPVYLQIGTSTLTPTTTSVTSSVNPSSYGQAVTFTAHVAGGSGSGLTGNVTFYDGRTLLGSGSISGTSAFLTTSALASGTHSISATYAGNATYSGSNSPSYGQTVGAGGTVTATALTSSFNPSIAGTSITLVAKVTSSMAGVAGTVMFKDGSTTLGTVTLSGGVASYSTSSLNPAAHSITAVYSGGSGFAPSTSAALVQSVLQPTSIVLSSTANPSAFGQFLTLTATVKGTASGQNGYVTFFDGGLPLSSVPLNGSVASLTTSALSKGTHPIMAVYGGSAIYAGSSSTTGSQVVQ